MAPRRSTASTITTAGLQHYGDNVELGKDATLASTGAGDVTFDGTVTGSHELIVKTKGDTFFQNLVNIATLTTDAGGVTHVNGGFVTTSGFQSYGDNVEIGADATFASTGAGDVSFNGTLTGQHKLVVNTHGDTFFEQPVNVATLNIDAGGATHLNGGSFTTSGSQTYGDNVLRANWLVSSTGGASVSFEGTVSGPHQLEVKTDGDTIFQKPLTVDGDNRRGRHDPIQRRLLHHHRLPGLRRQRRPGDATVRAGSYVKFGQKVDGSFNLTVETSDDTTFGGAVNVKTITTDAGGTTHLDGLTFTTSGLLESTATTSSSATTRPSRGPAVPTSPSTGQSLVRTSSM